MICHHLQKYKVKYDLYVIMGKVIHRRNQRECYLRGVGHMRWDLIELQYTAKSIVGVNI